MSALSVENEREIQPMQLSLEQLNQLKQQHEDEIAELNKQVFTYYYFILLRQFLDNFS